MSGFDLRPCLATTTTVVEVAVDTVAMAVRHMSFLFLPTLRMYFRLAVALQFRDPESCASCHGICFVLAFLNGRHFLHVFP